MFRRRFRAHAARALPRMQQQPGAMLRDRVYRLAELLSHAIPGAQQVSGDGKQHSDIRRIAGYANRTALSRLGYDGCRLPLGMGG